MYSSSMSNANARNIKVLHLKQACMAVVTPITATSQNPIAHLYNRIIAGL
jgi:hypothetical protein